ncbi:unnamed protein product, partial [Pelagomonas calceolata]
QRGGGPLERVAPRRAVAEVRARRMAPRRRGDRAPRVVGGRVRELGEDRAVGRAARIYRSVVACRRGGAVDVERGRRGEAAPHQGCEALHGWCLLCRHGTRFLSSYQCSPMSGESESSHEWLQARSREEHCRLQNSSGRQLFI